MTAKATRHSDSKTTRHWRIAFAGVICTAALAGLGPASGIANAGSECVPEEVDISAFIIDGEVDLEGYLAAVAAANAVCEGGAELPGTGSDQSSILIAGTALLALGAGGVAVSRRRQSVAA